MQVLNQCHEILAFRLGQKGIDQHLIPGFIRILGSSLLPDPNMNISEVNQRLQYLGWDSCELDYHTLQLAIVCLEGDHSNIRKYCSNGSTEPK